ncbi:hypothetical protein BUALT_Bualt07G0018900 [Buddleja alternifolia]|uniref:Uncharacterized protein n=1 Tax=Buddleja alternifolia TaxID=168488 RepID=A0AAV6X8L0_9LAMI|nr:hypothetical protein BUALT_Bualt07G0018900 [Buddleja alternifolia]
MAERAVTFLLENLKQLITCYPELISGAENELKQLMNELSSFKTFLKDMGHAAKKSKQEESSSLREMEKKIKEVIYELEDTIDSYLTLQAPATAPTKKRDFFLRPFKAKRLISLAQQVKSLRQDKVKPMLERAMLCYADMQISDGSGTSAGDSSLKVKKVPLIREENVIGLDEAEWTLTNYLKEETDELDVISIVGMLGLGKTTLAWKIFQNEIIQHEFPTRVWIYVSQEFNRKDVLLRILKEFTNEDKSYMSDLELAATVRGFLETGKFLLVLDDVWTVEAWNDIQDVLTKSNSNAKVLITSRNTEVATLVSNVNGEPYMLRFLTEEESWELLQVEIFGKLDDCPIDFVEIGKYIAKQCDGLPLSVVVIGKFLKEKLSTMTTIDEIIKEWMNVAENVSAQVKNNVLETIVMSYNALPDELRDCFIYLGVFPQYYEIFTTWTLTRLWIAEGFIQQKEGQSLEETAEENLNELVNKNLVVVDKKNVAGKVKICRVNNVIREFCNSKVDIGEHNLFQEIKLLTRQGVFDPPISDVQKCRRLCIHSNLEKFLFEKPVGPCLRSFLCFYKDRIILNPKFISTIPKAFHLLRVLESQYSFKFTEFPTKITKLIHLRYVTLSFDDLNVLPEAMSDLWNLQTLIVDTRSSILTINANIWNMIQLRHLKTEASIILAGKGEGKAKAGENLQTLGRLSPECCTKDVFNKARHLKELGIRGRLATLFEITSLDKLDRLENLKLLNDIYPESASENPIHNVPKSNWFPPNLKKLTLSGTFLDWKHMTTLGMIDTLEVLKLKYYAFMGEYWGTVSGGFPRLQVLQIGHTNLVSWEASGDEFPSLVHLMLLHCEELDEIPKRLVKRLQKLYLYGVSKSATESAERIVFMIGYKQYKGKQNKRWARWGGPKLFIGPKY